MPCGSGPTVEADGLKISTRLVATMRDLIQLREVPAVVCQSDAPTKLKLSRGVNRVLATPSLLASAVRLSLTPGAALPAVAQSEINITSWETAKRSIAITASDRARVLVVRENVNGGWKATSGGLVLPPVVLDGWQQGWFVAPGLGGDIVLTFEPDGLFRAAIFGGAGLAVGLVLVAVLPGSRRTAGNGVHLRRRSGRWIALAAGALGLAFIGGIWAATVAALILTSFAVYRLFRARLSIADRKRVRFTVNALTPWLPPVLVCLAGIAWWSSERPFVAALPQLLALTAVVILWLSTMSRPVAVAAAKMGKNEERALDQVVADDGEQQAGAEHEREGGDQVAGEDLAATGPVDQRDYEWVP
jgi:arabinofuranan 3-O-arabinosyltransferase